MPSRRTLLINKIYCFIEMSYLIAKVKTAVVVKKRPTAAVAVKSDKFI